MCLVLEVHDFVYTRIACSIKYVHVIILCDFICLYCDTQTMFCPILFIHLYFVSLLWHN